MVTSFFCGILDSSNPIPSNGLIFAKEFADTNWFARASDGLGSIRGDTLVPVDTGWHRFRIRRSSSISISFTIDDGVAVGVAGFIPTVSLTPRIGVQTNVAMPKTLDVDYYSNRISSLVR